MTVKVPLFYGSRYSLQTVTCLGGTSEDMTTSVRFRASTSILHHNDAGLWPNEATSCDNVTLVLSFHL